MSPLARVGLSPTGAPQVQNAPGAEAHEQRALCDLGAGAPSQHILASTIACIFAVQSWWQGQLCQGPIAPCFGDKDFGAGAAKPSVSAKRLRARVCPSVSRDDEPHGHS